MNSSNPSSAEPQDNSPPPGGAPADSSSAALEATLSLNRNAPDQQLADVLEQYLADLQAGRNPDRQQLLAAHPDLAGMLENCLSGMEFIHRAASPAANAGIPMQLGDFRLVREVGRGGMGVVYEAEQISLKRRVALKVLRFGAAADSEAMQRFQREAETVAGLHHTNIVPIFAIGCEEGVNYYAMQFIEGRSLADVQKAEWGEHRETRQKSKTESVGLAMLDPLYKFANWGLQAAEALAHAHQRGVIHRDIKPSNLILDPDGRIWLTDFGLAKRMDDVSLSLAGAILGTPRYMSPEQASAAKHPVDHRTDIYSLGATLYELATGRPLFEADSPHAVITQILNAEPPAPRVLCPDLPRDLETIILKCLAKEPAQRYQSAQALADDLRAFAEGRAIKARRATLSERTARWFKQQKRSVSVAAMAVAATVFVLTGSLIAWQMYSQSQIAYLTLESPRDDALRAEVAQVMTLNDEPVGSPFTLPTKEPVTLPAGAYRLRLTAPSKLSRDYLFDVVAGQQVKFDVGLLNETAGWPIAMKSPAGVEVTSVNCNASGVRANGQARVPVDGPASTPMAAGLNEPRLFVGPQDPNKPTMRCYAANSQPGWKPDGTRETEVTPLWEADWSVTSPLVKPLLDDHNNEDAWKLLLRWFEPWWHINGRPPKLVQPLCDVDGDGVADPIWRGPQTNPQGPPSPLQTSAPLAALIAASGQDGRPLWWYRAQDHNGSPAQLLGEPVLSLDDPVRPKLLAVLRTTAAVWVEAFDARTGKSVWKREVPQPVGMVHQAVAQGALLELTPFSGDGSRWMVMVAASRFVMALDVATGEPFQGPHDLGPTLLETPRFADLDGDGLFEVLHTVQRDQGIRDAAFAMIPARTLWEVPSSFGVGAWHHNEPRHIWPLAADLDGDGKTEVILPGVREEGSQVSDGCRVLNGLTGEPLWTRRIPRRAGFTHWRPEQYTVGPDLDGDGHREVFMASIRSEYRPRLAREGYGHHYEEHLLYVDCFSGRDGQSVWWQRIPLGLAEHAAITGDIGELLWWGGRAAPLHRAGAFNKDGHAENVPRESLVIPVHRHPDTQADGGTHSIYVLSEETGRVEHQADDMALPRLIDWNNDGLDDLAVYVPDDPVRFASRGYWPEPVSGRLVVLRGAPQEAFRRLGPWHEEQDFDGDGIAELSRPVGGMSQDYAVQVASGLDGRVMSNWKTEWPETPRTSTVGEIESFPAPLGDFDGDGLADLLLTRSTHFWDWDSDPERIVNRGRIPLLIQAVSGRSGRRVWGGAEFPLPEAFRPADGNWRSASWQAHRGDHLMMTWLDAVDLNGDQRPELLLALRLAGERFPRPTDGSDLRQQQEFLTLMDGRDGSLRWTEPFTKLTPGDQSWTSQGGRLRLDVSTDLNHDGTRDMVMIVPRRTPEGWWSGDLEARDGRDGKALWGPVALNGNWYNSDDLRAPVVSDLDGDSRAEIIILEMRDARVRVLNGDTGATRWIWQGHHQPNFAVPGLVVIQSRLAAEESPATPRPASRTSSESDRATSVKESKTAPDDSSRGERPLRCVAITLNETGSQWELVLLDHGGQVTERVPASIQLWSHDLDGDGFEELLRPGNNRITASRGLHDTIWEWVHPAEFGYASVSRFDRTADGRVIVTVSSGDALALLDGPTGKPLGRTFKSTNTSLSENGRSVELNHPRLVEPFENSRLLTRAGDAQPMLDHVVSRTVLPAEGDGRYRRGEQSSRRATSSELTSMASADVTGIAKSGSAGASPSRLLSNSDDPRFIRQLPWAPSEAEWAAGKGEILKNAGLAAGLAFVVVLFPFWMIRAGVRRKEPGWWRAALIISGMAVFATSLIVFRFAPPGAVWHDVPWALPIAIGIAALPGLAWIAALLRNLINGEWRRLLWLLGGSVLAALVLAALILSLTASQKPPEQHYSWHAWWFILLFGAHAVGILLVIQRILGPAVIRLWKYARRRLSRHA